MTIEHALYGEEKCYLEESTCVTHCSSDDLVQETSEFDMLPVELGQRRRTQHQKQNIAHSVFSMVFV